MKNHQLNLGICNLTVLGLDHETHIESVKRAIVALCEYVEAYEKQVEMNTMALAPKIGKYLEGLQK